MGIDPELELGRMSLLLLLSRRRRVAQRSADMVYEALCTLYAPGATRVAMSCVSLCWE